MNWLCTPIRQGGARIVVEVTVSKLMSVKINTGLRLVQKLGTGILKIDNTHYGFKKSSC